MTNEPQQPASNIESDAMAEGRIAPRASHALAHNHQFRHRVLRIRITDVATGRLKVGLTMPAGLLGVAVRLGARFLPAGHPANELISTVERGELRDPLVVDDVENGERVEISLEG